MYFDYSSLDIEMSRVPSSTPCIDNRKLEIYSVSAKLDNLLISKIDITLALNPNGKWDTDVLLFDLKKSPIQSLPFISHQKTHEDYQNKGINNYLIKLANKYYLNHFNSPLYSDILFSQAKLKSNPQLLCYPGKIVWQNLERDGFAKHIPFTNKNKERVDRWVMLPK